jgi:NAD(P)-dependent dehydrogenase (short-subunit alcohol dehydrogenase family)
MIKGATMKTDKKIRIFDGATAVITGGASGIGRALAEALAALGCHVMLADLQIELAEEVAASIHASGGKATAVKLDVTSFTDMADLLRETVKQTGRLDYIFNNAGIGIDGTADYHEIEDWNRIIDINLRGVVNGVQAAYPIMIKQGFGHIVNTASIAGLMPSPGLVSYATTKHAVVGLSNSLRGEAAQFGIRVSVLCPGFIRTAILDRGGKYGRVLVERSPEQQQRLMEMFEKYKPMEPSLFAKKALGEIAKNRATIIIPSWYHLFWWIHRLLPSLGLFLARKSFQDIQAKLVTNKTS